MGKRSDSFPRESRDFYKTPREAVTPLINFLPKKKFTFAEPCAGDGRLIRHVESLTDGLATCTYASDIEPQEAGILKKDALHLRAPDLDGVDMIITNPPWDRRPATGKLLHNLIQNFVCGTGKPTWLLFDADWMHTVQAAPYLDWMVASVSIGRVKWIEGSKMTGKDNCQWALFDINARRKYPAPLLLGRGHTMPEGTSLLD